MKLISIKNSTKEKDVNNRELVINLVKKHFSLSSESFSRFEDQIRNPKILEEFYEKYFKGKKTDGLRVRTPLSLKQKAKFDVGYKILNKTFGSILTDKNKISYSEFIENKKTVNKNSIKLIKFITKLVIENKHIQELKKLRDMFYIGSNSSFTEDEVFGLVVKNELEKIGAKKLPKGNLEFVISFDFVDWFLSSTSESWGSCINLDSDYEYAVWAGLPGLVGNKNLFMVYITEEKTYKLYKEMKSDKILARTWVNLGKNNEKSEKDKDEFFKVRWYPNVLLRKKSMTELLDYKVNKISDMRTTKYPLDLLFNREDNSLYIYLDKQTFEVDENENVFLSGSKSSDFYYVTKNSKKYINNESIYDFCGGLSQLYSDRNEILDYPSGLEHFYCESCSYSLTEDEVFYYNEEIFCESCYEDIAHNVDCERCGDRIHESDICYINNEEVCDSCYEEIEEEERLEEERLEEERLEEERLEEEKTK